ncbi:hypothetical protein J2X60_001901 [Curtobacterium sp. 320]|uniref:hypothetical protein n=1 Tax=Curtobacterium sp. 320 TaxID=2817749 RepID=UPI0028591523|nr:hypothetical protein [Curtobacterium sp. 320]MDR6573255.1 hypothetical protein [Curtobacterium sp. 320]
MDIRVDPAEPGPDAEQEPEPRWVRRTPILPEQWWGPPAAQVAGVLVVLAIGIWLQRAALPVAILVSVVVLAGAVVLAAVGRRAYWYPSRAAAWRLHRTRVTVWGAAGVCLAAFALAVGAQALLFALGAVEIGLRSARQSEPTRFELRGRSVAVAGVAVASTVFAVVALTVPAVDETYSSRWVGWSVVIVPLTVILAVLHWRAASKATDADLDGTEPDVRGQEPPSDDPLSARDRTAS